MGVSVLNPLNFLFQKVLIYKLFEVQKKISQNKILGILRFPQKKIIYDIIVHLKVFSWNFRCRDFGSKKFYPNIKNLLWTKIFEPFRGKIRKNAWVQFSIPKNDILDKKFS